jgi:hypothetical protein
MEAKRSTTINIEPFYTPNRRGTLVVKRVTTLKVAQKQEQPVLEKLPGGEKGYTLRLVLWLTRNEESTARDAVQALYLATTYKPEPARDLEGNVKLNKDGKPAGSDNRRKALDSYLHRLRGDGWIEWSGVRNAPITLNGGKRARGMYPGVWNQQAPDGNR